MTESATSPIAGELKLPDLQDAHAGAERSAASHPSALTPLPVKLDSTRLVIQISVILIGAAGFAWTLHSLIGSRHPHTSWFLMASLAAMSLISGCWGAIRRWRDYATPMHRFLDLLPKIRLGESPIDELSTIQGGLAPLIPEIQSLLRDLRQEKVHNATLQFEIRQRVHSRTESLERKIGSLKHQASRDGLTGLSNRRELDQQLPAVIKQCKLSGADLCLLMIDVDYFKTLNDTLGHAAGDDLLKQIAQIIRSSIRQTDLAFRCGGDEFMIVLPGASLEVGKNLSERLRSLVDALAKTLRVPRRPRLSIGLATMQQTNVDNAPDLMALADKALYDVKASRPGASRAE